MIVLMDDRLGLVNTWSKIIETKEKIIKHNDVSKSIKISSKKDSLSQIGEFEWILHNFSANKRMAERKLLTSIDSDPFYTHENGYKLSLTVFPNGATTVSGHFLSVGFSIMRGPFDHLLTWPMKHRVILELINQQTDLVHLTYTAQYDLNTNDTHFQRPTSDINDPYGFPEFISLEELLHNEELIKNDQLIIRSRIILIN